MAAVKAAHIATPGANKSERYIEDTNPVRERSVCAATNR